MWRGLRGGGGEGRETDWRHKCRWRGGERLRWKRRNTWERE